MYRSTHERQRNSRRPIIAVVLIITVTALAVPPAVAADTIRESARALTSAWVWFSGARTARGRNGMPELPAGGTVVKPPAQLSRSQREARVASLEINKPGPVVLRSRETMQFMAIPLDSAGATVHSVQAQWESTDKQVVFIRKNGQAVSGKPGMATLRVRAGNVTRTVHVTVIEGSREPYGGKKKINSRRGQSIAQLSTPADAAIPSNRKLKRHHANTVSSAFLRDPNEDPLPDGETVSLYETANLVGNVLGKTSKGGIRLPFLPSTPSTETNGNKNFSFGLPIVGLSGRGVNVSLGITYNSLLWNKSSDGSTTQLTYDVDSAYPAPGFRIGFGQIEDQGTAGFTLTDADGTRHALVYSGTSYNYDTNDGTFIHFTGGSGGGTLYYPNGTRVTYGASGGGYRSYPTCITDRNGNQIYISYVNEVGPRIYGIQDTLERYIRFYHDSSSGDLVRIEAPGLTVDREVMRLYYEDKDLTVSNLFGSGISLNLPTGGTAHVLKYIYVTDSSDDSNGHVGYRFDYSPYGMIREIKQFHGMTINSTSVTSDGTQATSTLYDYPSTASTLTDVPTFSTQTDDWAGRTTGMPGTGNAPSYTFAESSGVTTVTAPDGTIEKTTRIVNPGNWNDGFISEVRVIALPSPSASPTPVYAKTEIAWQQNSSNSTARIESVKVTNEAQQTRAVVYSYDDTHTPYNNVSVVSERELTNDGTISSTVLRRTETTYVTSSSYLSRRLLHLPSIVKVFPGTSSTAAARIDYAYDDYGSSHANLTARDNLIMHDDAFDPFQEMQENCDWECQEWGWPEEGPYGCLDWQWVCHFYTPYDSTTDYRGNVTSVTTYADAGAGSGGITRDISYDIAGNVVTAEVDCCQLQSFTYSSADDDYVYPISITRGNPSGLHLTSSLTYNMNTGLVLTATDANSQDTDFYYNSASLRLDHADFADGGQVSYDYGDALVADYNSRYHFFVKSSTKLDSSRVVDSYQYFDGRGALTQSFDTYTSGDGWSTRNIEYDLMGRAYRASNPYYSSGYGAATINPDGFWTTRTFDRLGRVTQVAMPRGDNDNSLTTSVTVEYAGTATKVTDQAGKQRRQIVDALGRLIELHEPNTSGSLGEVGSPNQKTEYQYDVLDNLVKITQGSQNRYFKYDSLSRLIRERQVEQTPYSAYDLSDSLTSNSSWTRKIEYNSQNLISRSSDARGWDTDLSYDDLNRLTGIDYEDSATPDTHYYYDSQTLPSGAPSYTHGSANGRLIAMTYGSGATGTYFGYDTMGRVNVQKQVTGSTTYSLAYSYNLAGLLATETYPTNRVLTYSFDNAARLSQVSDGTTTFANSFSYAASGGLLSETWGNTAVNSMTYNRRLQTSQAKLMLGSNVLQQYDYGYGDFNSSTGAVDTSKNSGQIARIQGTIGSTMQWTQGFNYDSIGRLGTASEYQGNMGSVTWQQTFTYDRYGNRFQSGSVVSGDINAGTNQFISTGSTPITYDETGNILQDMKFRLSGSLGMKYEYDANGRQTVAKLSDNTPLQTSVYDCAGQRVQTTAGGTIRTIVYDIFGQAVTDYSGSSLERENVYRGGMLLATYEAGSGAWRYVLQDVQGSTRAVVSNNGSSSTVLARHDYLPFGEEIGSGVGLRTSGQGYAATDTSRQRFAMMERDSTGLDHTWFRKYESIAGRWTSPDALGGNVGNPQSFNRYAYVLNDPVNLIDPAGLEPCGPSAPCIIYDWGPGLIERSGSAGSLAGSTGLRIVDPFPEGPGGPTGGGPAPTPTDRLIDRARQLEEQPDRNDCRALVELMAYAGDLFQNVIGATNALGNVLAGGDVVRLGLRAIAGRLTGRHETSQPIVDGFGSAGFLTIYQDHGSSPNQVRHSIGGLLAGTARGMGGLATMNANEPDPTGDGAADIRLNGVMVPLGAGLQLHNGEFGTAKTLAGRDRMRQLATDVENGVCDPNVR